MKTFIKYSVGCLALAGMAMFSSCEDATNEVLTHQAFIAQTNTNGNSAKKLTIGNEAVSAEISVRLSDLAVEKSTYRIVPDAQALEIYNDVNSTPYVPLPEGSYTLSATDVSIEAGTNVSEIVKLTINPFSREMKNSGKKYAIALKLEKKSGNVGVLESGSTMVYFCDRVVYQAVPTFNYQLAIKKPEFKEPFELNNWTIEFNVNMSRLGSAVGSLNNQALFSNNGSEEIYIRFGDAMIPGTTLQIKYEGTQMNSKQQFDQGHWYHLAFVSNGTKLSLYVNGVLDNAMDTPGRPVKMKGFDMFNTDYFKSQVQISEMKIWQVARSQAELENNMYVCDPATEGLVGYWKFDEGEGSIYKDSSKHGNNLTTPYAPVWTPNVRIDGK